MLEKKNAFKNQHSRGASMVELLAFVGIMAVTMLGLATQLSQNSQQSATLKKDFAFQEIVTEVETFANSQTLCTNLLKGTAVPAVGAPAILPIGLNTLAAGSTYQNGALKLTQLQWVQIVQLSLVESIGYLSLTADINPSGGPATAGGNLRSFPPGGSTPPGILVDMQTDPGTHLITSCGSSGAGADSTEYLSVPVTVNTNDSWDFQGDAVLPIAYADNNYVIICSVVNPLGYAYGANYGQFTPTALLNTGFHWHYWQERGNFIPNGSVLTAECITHHN